MRVALALAIAALVAPSAAATWYVAGTWEPDTSYDSPEWMFADPPPAGVARIYFNGITTAQGTVGATPNVGLLETRNEAPASEAYFAFLGVWKDCNGDGYIGMAEQGVREYPATLLLGNTVNCPPVTGTGAWPAGAHNYNGWVTEFAWLVTSSPGRVYPDPALQVWGDYERPDHDPVLGWCPTTPLPRGTQATTGGLIQYFYCSLDQRGIDVLGSFNTAVDLVGDPLGLRFENEHDATSGSLGQVETFGPEDQSHAPAYVWDCDSTPTNVGPARVWAVDPRLGNPDPTQWTIPAFWNATYDGIHPLDNCDWTDDRASGFYQNENDYNPVNPYNKTEADWNFVYTREGMRGGPPAGPVFGAGPSGAPFDAGVGYTFSPQYGGWNAENGYGRKLASNTIRASLDEGVDIAPAYWITYYASLGQATLDRGFARPTNAGGIYGQWQCGVNESGIHHGWNCDKGVWYTNPDGSPYVSTSAVARVGQRYDLRDVDCYDGNTALGIAIGLPAYGEDPCR